VPHGFELAIFGLLAAACVALPVRPGPAQGGSLPAEIIGIFPVTAGGFFSALNNNFRYGAAGLVLLLTLLILCRVIPWRWAFLAAAVAIPVAAVGYSFLVFTMPVVREVNSEPALLGLKPGIPVPFYVLSLKSAIPPLLALLGALYAVRRGFEWWKYLAGWALALVLAYAVLFWAWPVRLTPDLFAAVVVNGVTVGAMVLLPLQRQILEELMGFRLTTTDGSTDLTTGAAPSFAASVFGHFGLLLVFALTVFFGAVGWFEMRAVRLFTQGPEPPHISAGSVNAYEALKLHFIKEQPLAVGDMMKNLGERENAMLGGIPAMSPDVLKQYLAAGDWTKLDSFFAALEPVLAKADEASRADICLFSEPGRTVPVNFLAVRTVARALELRACRAMVDGRKADALADIERIVRFGGILGTDPAGTLVHQLISSAVRGVGLAGARNFFLFYRDDPAALETLNEALDRMGPMFRRSFPTETIRRTEMAFWDLVPWYEAVVPGTTRAGINYYAQWAGFDQLRLLVALERHRAAHGQYPASLEALVPQYLRHVPKDPFEGKPYEYELLDGEPVIRVPYLEQGPAEKMKVRLLPPPAQLREESSKLLQELLQPVSRKPAQ
jgi:hypothetical protein